VNSLKREASQQAKAVWEKREDFASLKCKFPFIAQPKRGRRVTLRKGECGQETQADSQRMSIIIPFHVQGSEYQSSCAA
jgi:hypothetical protein